MKELGSLGPVQALADCLPLTSMWFVSLASLAQTAARRLLHGFFLNFRWVIHHPERWQSWQTYPWITINLIRSRWYKLSQIGGSLLGFYPHSGFRMFELSGGDPDSYDWSEELTELVKRKMIFHWIWPSIWVTRLKFRGSTPITIITTNYDCYYYYYY